MSPLLLVEGLFVCFFQGKRRVSCPPEREGERRGGGCWLELPSHLWPRLPWRPSAPAVRASSMNAPQATSQRDGYVRAQRRQAVSMSDVSQTQNLTETNTRNWATMVSSALGSGGGNLLSGPTAFIYISLTLHSKPTSNDQSCLKH